MIRSKNEKCFDFIVYAYLITTLIVVFYPLWFVGIASISDPRLVVLGRVWWKPMGIQMDGYKYIMQFKEIWTGYRNTIFYTVLGTFLNLVVTIPFAYSLSKKYLPGRKMIMVFILITMYFSGGIVPTFIIVNKIGLAGTFWPVLLLTLTSPYNIIISRTYFERNVPEELEQAAMIDGCNNIRLFFQIVLPLSKPIVVVIALFCAVGHWNSFFNALIYLSNKAYYPLQLILREILISSEQLQTMANVVSEQAEDAVQRQNIAETIKYGLIIVSTLPLLIVYPFLQRYFVQGIMIGSVKG